MLIPLKYKRLLVLDENNEPDPDISICKYREDYYHDGLPKADDIDVIIEVADSTYQWDKEFKSTLYASKQISIYWIIAINKNQIEVFSNPQNELYKKYEIFSEGDEIPLLGHVLKVNDIIIKTTG